MTKKEQLELPGFAGEVLISWTECRPKMVKFLKQNGVLEEALLLADTRARERSATSFLSWLFSFSSSFSFTAWLTCIPPYAFLQR